MFAFSGFSKTTLKWDIFAFLRVSLFLPENILFPAFRGKSQETQRGSKLDNILF